jgi:hypothetical protein
LNANGDFDTPKRFARCLQCCEGTGRRHDLVAIDTFVL